nr:pif3 [Apis mellifera nudivirus]
MLIFFVFIILFAIWMLLQLLQKIKPENFARRIRSEEVSELLGKGSQSELGKRDCNVETLYAMDDEQCANICRSPGIFQVRHGACVNVLAFESKSSLAMNKCDPKRGVLAYLIGNSQFGSTSLLCLSIDLGIQPDNADEAANRICSGGGKIDINYLLGFPQISNCKCPSGKILTVIESTSTIRPYGQCASRLLKPIFEYNKLLFTSNPV